MAYRNSAEATPPSFTIKDLMAQIPARCFERSSVKSIYYLLRTIVFTGLLLWAAVTYIPRINPQYISLPYFWMYPALRFVAWNAYGFAQGVVGFGYMIIFHECGHRAFSPSKALNDAVGYICASWLLFPYGTWASAHVNHHGHVSELEKVVRNAPAGLADSNASNSSIVEIRRTQLQDALEESFPYVFLRFVQAYLVEGSADRKNRKMKTGSNLGMFATAAIFVYCAKQWGTSWVLLTYGLPYLWVNHWSVIVVLLSHADAAASNHVRNSHTAADELFHSCDRDIFVDQGLPGKMGNWVFRKLFMSITDTHVVHHLFPRIPHYHRAEATEAVRQFLAPHGIKTTSGPCNWSEFGRAVSECQYF